MKMKPFLSALLAFCLLLTLVPGAAVYAAAETPTYQPQTDWYTLYENEFEEFVINTPQELLGFAKLLQGGTDFAGKTIKLGTDIDLNPGWTAGKESVAAVNNWNSDAKNHSGKFFRGTFDGQNHTVSGIYYSGYETFHGMFLIGIGATVKNLNIANSVFAVTGWRAGVLFGSLRDSVSTVDSVSVANDVYLLHAGGNRGVSTGGLCGQVENDAAALEIRNTTCAAYVADTNAAREGRAPRIGGLVGDPAGRTVKVDHSTFSGDIVIANGNYACAGLMVGGGFTVPTTAAPNIGEMKNVTITASCGAIGTPGAFNAFLASLKHAQFKTGENTFTLTADIDMTGMTAINGMSGNTPELSAFSGSFDGNGHTISNVTLNCTANYDGLFGNAMDATVKNVNFANCIVTGRIRFGIGGLFGAVLGTTVLENIKADMTVTRTKDTGAVNALGGLVATAGFGSAYPANLTLRNCIFDGSVNSRYEEASENAGKPRLAGGLVGLVQSDKTVCEIDTCAFRGTICADDAINGGVVGRIDAGTLTIRNCYSAGSYQLATSNAAGLILGQKQGGEVTLTDCAYVADDSISNVSAGSTTGFCTVPADAEVLLNGVKLSGGTATVALRYYQFGENGVRLIFCTDSLDYEALTLELEITAGGETKKKTVTVQTVYEAVMADGVQVTAAKLGSAYVAALVLNGLPAGDAFVRVRTCADGTATAYQTFCITVPAVQ